MELQSVLFFYLILYSYGARPYYDYIIIKIKKLCTPLHSYKVLCYWSIFIYIISRIRHMIIFQSTYFLFFFILLFLDSNASNDLLASFFRELFCTTFRNKFHNSKDVEPVIDLITFAWKVNEWNKITIKRPQSAFGIYGI